MSEPRRWGLLFWSKEDSRNVVASREIIQPVAPNQILLEVIEAEPVLARIKELETQLKEANEVAEFYAKKSSWSRGGTRARAYLKKWEGN